MFYPFNFIPSISEGSKYLQACICPTISDISYECKSLINVGITYCAKSAGLSASYYTF